MSGNAPDPAKLGPAALQCQILLELLTRNPALPADESGSSLYWQQRQRNFQNCGHFLPRGRRRRRRRVVLYIKIDCCGQKVLRCKCSRLVPLALAVFHFCRKEPNNKVLFCALRIRLFSCLDRLAAF